MDYFCALRKVEYRHLCTVIRVTGWHPALTCSLRCYVELGIMLSNAPIFF